MSQSFQLNDRARCVADALAERPGEYRVCIHEIAGARVINAGIEPDDGGLNAGLMLARICMADLGDVCLAPGHVGEKSIPFVTVVTDQPVSACMASQYAGWQISVDKYFAMGSGPMRAAYGKEELYDDIGYREDASCAVGVLETAELPTVAVVEKIAGSCGVKPADVTLVVARTASLAGGLQVTARSVETAMHKLHEIGFDLARIVAGFGTAPLPPVAKDDLAAIGRTNDAMLYGVQTTLYVTGDDDSVADAVSKLPSSASKDYGEPFGAIFKRHDHDFYKIDPMLFSPAAVVMQNIETGRTHAAGHVNHEVLQSSFFN